MPTAKNNGRSPPPRKLIAQIKRRYPQMVAALGEMPGGVHAPKLRRLSWLLNFIENIYDAKVIQELSILTTVRDSHALEQASSDTIRVPEYIFDVFILMYASPLDVHGLRARSHALSVCTCVR